MNTHMLNIPSVVSHSYFTLGGKITHLLEKEINYFYSLLYLYRNSLLNQSISTVFLKSENQKNYHLNSEFKNFEIKIELLQFNELGIVNNYSYTDLRAFLEILQQIDIKVNILGKNKTIKSTSIGIVEKYKIDKDNILHIKFTDKFVEIILHTEKYFMKVDLDILFNLSGYKSKKLYLFLKDYSNYKNQCIKISEENLIKLIGNIPSKKILNEMIDSINKVHGIDMKIYNPTTNGKKLKEYRFEFKNLTQKSKLKKKENLVDDKLLKQSIEITDKKIKEGKVSEDKREVYQKTVYDNLLKTTQPKEKSVNEIELEEYYTSIKEEIKSNNDLDSKYNHYIYFIHNDNDFYLDNDYKLFLLGFQRKYITDNAEETLRLLRENEFEFVFKNNFHAVIKGCDISLI